MTSRNLMKNALAAVGSDPGLADVNHLSIFNDYGKGWKRVNFYGLGNRVSEEHANALKAELKRQFPNFISCEIGYHIKVKVSVG